MTALRFQIGSGEGWKGERSDMPRLPLRVTKKNKQKQGIFKSKVLDCKIQTRKRFKITLFIGTKHNLQYFGVIPFIKPQNNT